MFITIVIVVIAIITVGVIIDRSMRAADNRKHKEEVGEAYSTLEDFTETDTYLSESSGISISFDNGRKKICFFDKSQQPFIYNYNEILQCEVVVDGQTILKHSTTGTIGRAILGGVLGGGIGAIIGGTTGASKQDENINNIDLKIIINDPANPVFRVNFLDTTTKKGSELYKEAYSKVEMWHGIFAGLIRQGNKDEDAKPKENLSVADELIKLKSLQDSGVITEEEFAKQKTKLIG
jgi:Short C-terminal domain